MSTVQNRRPPQICRLERMAGGGIAGHGRSSFSADESAKAIAFALKNLPPGLSLR
jgi:hypothetical protein